MLKNILITAGISLGVLLVVFRFPKVEAALRGV
jgi:hypothetical protein